MSGTSSSERTPRSILLLLALAAVVAAAVTARAAFLGSDATGAWQTALRQELKRGGLASEQVRFVYSTEGDQAFSVAIPRVRAEELRAEAARQPPDIAPMLVAEAQVHEGVATALEPASAVASDDRYATLEGGFDLLLRLAHERATTPDALVLLPDLWLRVGDEAADRAIRTMAAAVPVGVAFLFAAMAQALRRPRRPLTLLGWLALAVAVAMVAVVELAS